MTATPARMCAGSKIPCRYAGYMNPFDGCRVRVQRTGRALRCVALHKHRLRRCHQPLDVKLDDSEPLQQTNLLK